MTSATPRPATEDDVPALARLWQEGWQDAHAGLVPAELARARTLESFGERLLRGLAHVRAIGPIGDPDGFSYVAADQLDQFYVHRRARGSGVAAPLLADAERRLAASGVATAWLACAIGNDRAARFYEKSGWTRAGTVTITLDISNGRCPLDVWRYEKALGGR
ncbi:GNAT family N-acetyltransferase [Faunimonas sp. B44]|uniref:GNAT family N-acetyltransferase n=1 Tax=Faunimonas sp. B44 TaxID=3461493 RepID=UPI0040439F47